MDVLSKTQLKELMTTEADACVSLYLPTHRDVTDSQQDLIQLRNLLDEAQTRLVERGLGVGAAQTLLGAGTDLLMEAEFWTRQSDGLAVFISPDSFKTYRLPIDLEPLAVAGPRLHSKPLLSLGDGLGRFYILAISHSDVRLLQGTRFSVDEIELKDVPKSLDEALQADDPERELQFHVSQPAPQGMGRGVAMFHGNETSDEPRKNLQRFFNKVDRGLRAVLADDNAPMVLVGVDYLLPIYRDVNSYRGLLDEGVIRSPEDLSAQELHERAWSIVEPIFRQPQVDAAEKFAQYTGGGRPLASADLADVMLASYMGRVDSLFVACWEQQWGAFDPDTGKAKGLPPTAPEAEDLLDVAARQTYLAGGTVYPVDTAEIPGGGLMAAVYRF